MQPDNIITAYHTINWQSIIQSQNWEIPIVFLLLIVIIALYKYNKRQVEYHALQAKRHDQLSKENDELIRNLKIIHADAEKNVCKFDLSPQSMPKVDNSTTVVKSVFANIPTKNTSFNEQADDDDVEITPMFLPKTPIVPPMFLTDEEISKAVDRVDVIGRKKI